jgi:signal transduction histidine kinase
VRVRHFILLPALAMALVLLLFRGVDGILMPWFTANGEAGLYLSLRSVVIGLFMASIIAMLALRYRKEMEALLVERERLAAVGELAAVVAHEVRNPLAGIRGGCELLLEGTPEGDPRNEIGREVIHQVDRLNRTVQDLLMFARPKTIDPVPTDLHALLNRLIAVASEDRANEGVSIRRDFAPVAPIVRVDPRQMEQVFLNLLLNACQAMAHRGSITFTTGTDRVMAEVSLTDTGPGIPPDRLIHIFQPFFTTRAQGTGLGLAICRKLVEAHGGTIEADSPPGGGARFTVRLPRMDERGGWETAKTS